jgi:hypothetical protein
VITAYPPSFGVLLASRANHTQIISPGFQMKVSTLASGFAG